MPSAQHSGTHSNLHTATAPAAVPLRDVAQMYRVLKLVNALPADEDLFEGEEVRTLEPQGDEEDTGFQVRATAVLPVLLLLRLSLFFPACQQMVLNF
jgi:hypothetical protein